MKTYSNDYSEVYACDSYDRVQIGLHSRLVPDSRANFAMDLMKMMVGPASIDAHPGAVTKTAKEIAKIACDVAAAASAEFADRGWMIAVPDMNALRDDARDNRGEN